MLFERLEIFSTRTPGAGLISYRVIDGPCWMPTSTPLAGSTGTQSTLNCLRVSMRSAARLRKSSGAALEPSAGSLSILISGKT